MPQASPELRAKFPGYDKEALDVIKKNFTNKEGRIRRKDSKHNPTPREHEAILYLIHEWDYAYEI